MADCWIFRTEVTNRMYARCAAMGKCPSPASDPPLPDYTDPELDDRPMIGVKWEQAETYCRFVGGHLPTEAQWEKAARGPDGNSYPWGKAEPTCDLLNFNECLGETSDVIDYPEGRSDYNVLDMAGNVFEWVSDWYQENYYNEAPLQDPAGPGTGKYRSVRGSSFESRPDQIPSAMRHFLNPEGHRSDLGFRCVVADPYQYAPLCEMLAYVPPADSAELEPVTPETTGCLAQVPEIEVVNWCEAGKRHVNINHSPPRPEVEVVYSGSADCSDYDSDTVGCVGMGGETLEISVCQSCMPEAVPWAEPTACDPPYILDDMAGICVFTSARVPGTE